jgi:hypothetical protein
LSSLYKWIIEKHSIDTLIILDGGSDSLMKGDEYGLGDPIEDAVSVGAGASCHTLRNKFLISVGFGADAYNNVSNGASLRAVAELTQQGGFMGSMGIEKDSEGFDFYCKLVDRIYENQTFRSVLTSLIMESGNGSYGFIVPAKSGGRVRKECGGAYCWPLMSTMLAFDVDVGANRSLVVEWITEVFNLFFFF